MPILKIDTVYKRYIHSTHKPDDRHNFILASDMKHYPTTSGERLLCDCCSREISSAPFYKCRECESNLHKFCAEMPLEINHPSHPSHLLHLSTVTVKSRRLAEITCGHCKEHLETYYYYFCKRCNVAINVICASPPGFRIEHRSHEEHPLIPMREEVLFLCQVCGTKHEGRPFVCNTCGIWISRSCAFLPEELDQKNLDVEEMNYQEYLDVEEINYQDYHHHPLRLAHSLESLSSRYPQINQLKCHICAVGLDPRFGVYYCREDGCTYFAHERCARSTTEPFMSILRPPAPTHQVDLWTNVVHLPVANEFVSVVSHFRSIREFPFEMSVQFSHCHYDCLTLHDTLTNNDGLSGICNRCIQPLSPPFYACNICDFFLHETCSNVPSKVKFLRDVDLIWHDYSRAKEEMNIFDLFHCSICHRPSNGLCYIRDSFVHRVVNRWRSYQRTSIIPSDLFDVKCAFLPKSITHEAHSNHRLIISSRKYGPCPCCLLDDDPGKFIYRCDTCSFNLHPKCALYPRSVDHKYDKHPLRLTYKLKGRLSEEFYCEICELELNQRSWFYHCEECNQSFHPTCIPAVDYLSNIKFGGTLKLDCHVHPLTFDRLIVECPCGYCNKVIDVIKDGMAFHCKKCVKYKIHLECAKLLRAK